MVNPITDKAFKKKKRNPISDPVFERRDQKPQQSKMEPVRGKTRSRVTDDFVKQKLELNKGDASHPQTFEGMRRFLENQAGRADVQRAAEGRLSVEEQAQRDELLRRNEEIAAQVGITDPAIVQDITDRGFDVSEALAAGTIENIPGIVSKATTYGAGGAVLGAGAGSLISAPMGAAIGATTSVWSGIQRNIEEQRKALNKGEGVNLEEGKTDLTDIVGLAKANPSNFGWYVSQFNNRLSQIDQGHGQLKSNTDSVLEKFLADGRDEMIEFEIFNLPRGERENLIEEMQQVKRLV